MVRLLTEMLPILPTRLASNRTERTTRLKTSWSRGTKIPSSIRSGCFLFSDFREPAYSTQGLCSFVRSRFGPWFIVHFSEHSHVPGHVTIQFHIILDELSCITMQSYIWIQWRSLCRTRLLKKTNAIQEKYLRLVYKILQNANAQQGKYSRLFAEAGSWILSDTQIWYRSRKEDGYYHPKNVWELERSSIACFSDPFNF